jgi:hypothetical protein
MASFGCQEDWNTTSPAQSYKLVSHGTSMILIQITTKVVWRKCFYLAETLKCTANKLYKLSNINRKYTVILWRTWVVMFQTVYTIPCTSGIFYRNQYSFQFSGIFSMGGDLWIQPLPLWNVYNTIKKNNLFCQDLVANKNLMIKNQH